MFRKDGAIVLHHLTYALESCTFHGGLQILKKKKVLCPNALYILQTKILTRILSFAQTKHWELKRL